MTIYNVFDAANSIIKFISQVCIKNHKKRYMIKKVESDKKKHEINFHYSYYYKLHELGKVIYMVILASF